MNSCKYFFIDLFLRVFSLGEEGFRTDFTNSNQVTDTILMKNEAEDFRDKIVQLVAVPQIGKVTTVRASGDFFVCGTFFDRATLETTFFRTATITASSREHTAFTAHQAASSDEVFFRIFRGH